MEFAALRGISERLFRGGLPPSDRLACGPKASGWLALTLVAAAACLVCGPAHAGMAAGDPPPPSQIFTFLFLTLGPFKAIGPFAKATRGADRARDLPLALLAVGFASAALAFAGFVGENMLAKYGIPVPILGLAAGLILLLAALLPIVREFSASAVEDAAPAAAPATPLLRTAISPLAFPAIVTPYGVAAMVVFLALTPDLSGRLTLAAIVVGIMALDLVMMLLTRLLLPVFSVLLPILGAVLGVVQVALGLQIMNVSLRALIAM